MKLEGDASLSSIIQKIGSLSHRKWVSASGFHYVSMAGVLGIGGLFLAIGVGGLTTLSSFRWPTSHTHDDVDVDDDDNSLEEFWLVPGLQNLGNNCFLNVILQALASCSSVGSLLQMVTDECGSSLVEACPQGLSLTVALASLFKELCTVQHGRTVVSPRKVMLAMADYLPDFKLTSQQDAEEALLHLLSSLREEYSECYCPNYSSIADAIAFSNHRIRTLERRVNQSETERWQQCFVGPFDGILGSILTCQSCSFQISLNFEFFHTLHLSPVLRTGATVMPGCTVEDCLKQFIIAEKLDHYRCSRCWHIAAIKYLSVIGGDKTDIEKISCCSEQDSCDCKNLFGLERLPWSNSYSSTFKQLSITRCPKILCIHLQRASMNGYGELVKLQGHISFPLILDLSPFTSNGLEVRKREDNLQRWQAKDQCKALFPQISCLNMQFDTSMSSCKFGQKGKGRYSEAADAEEPRCSAFKSPGSTYLQAFQEEPNIPQTEGCSDTTRGYMQMQAVDKVVDVCHSARLDFDMFHLVSVVEHFGKSGSGHYTVYRRVRAKSGGENSKGQLNVGDVRWFCISDAEVHSVSENDVLAAEGSLLFYEKIVDQ